MKIGNKNINNKTYIIAEMSGNHGSKIEIAKDTIKAAKEAGADAIKLQTYKADTMTIDCNKADFIVKGGTLWDGKTLYELYKWASTPWEWHEELFNYARKIGIDIFSTPFDKTAVDFLEQFNPSVYKIASFEITDYELVRYIASKGKPVIISTGIATIQEIHDVVNICRDVGNSDIILLHCISAYPAPLEGANLKMIPNLTETFGVISGFSDHTLGISAPIAAVSLGAMIIEKHFILDKSIGGADADFSLDKAEFTEMVKAVRDTEKMLGKVDYTLTEKKKKSRHFSRSLYVVQDITKGEKLTAENIRSIRPGYGLHPKYYDEVIGKTAKCDIEKGATLEWKLIR